MHSVPSAAPRHKRARGLQGPSPSPLPRDFAADSAAEMEIIPILSTIILVATIATFILAVAAYILYKIRERKARTSGRTTQVTAPILAPQHTLVAPSPMLALPPAYGAGVPVGAQGYGSLAYGAPPPYPGLDVGYGAQGLPPMALDTNADGRPDTIFEPRPTQRDAYGQPTAYQPSQEAYSPYGGMGRETEAQPYSPSSVRGTPVYDAGGYGSGAYGSGNGGYGSPQPSYAAPSYGAPQAYGAQPVYGAPVPSYGVPAPPPPPPSGGLFFELTGQGLQPTSPSMPALAAPPDATDRALAAERAQQRSIDHSQDRLDDAEDASRARADALRQQRRDSDDAGLAWY